jgi:hypothetical protein
MIYLLLLIFGVLLYIAVNVKKLFKIVPYERIKAIEDSLTALYLELDDKKYIVAMKNLENKLTSEFNVVIDSYRYQMDDESFKKKVNLSLEKERLDQIQRDLDLKERELLMEFEVTAKKEKSNVDAAQKIADIEVAKTKKITDMETAKAKSLAEIEVKKNLDKSLANVKEYQQAMVKQS